MSRKKIITEALTWIDTPFHDIARVKGVGVDCAQLIAGVAENVGLIEKGISIPTYVVDWHIHNSDEKLLWYLEYFGCKRIDDNKKKAGDILTFKFGKCTSHLGILMPNDMLLHADKRHGKVVYHQYTGDFINRHTTTWKFPGIR